MFLTFVIVGREENIPMTKISQFTVSSIKPEPNHFVTAWSLS